MNALKHGERSAEAVEQRAMLTTLLRLIREEGELSQARANYPTQEARSLLVYWLNRGLEAEDAQHPSGTTWGVQLLDSA